MDDEGDMWEGLLAYEERDKILFSADLFIRRGKVEGPVLKAKRDEVLDMEQMTWPASK